MAVTISVVAKGMSENAYVTYADVTGPASYTTGGETLTVAQQGQLLPEFPAPGSVSFSTANIIFFESESEPANGRYCVLDRTNNKMLFFAGSQVASTTNLSAVTIRIRVVYGSVNLG